jgi:hypothetical protein
MFNTCSLDFFLQTGNAFPGMVVVLSQNRCQFMWQRIQSAYLLVFAIIFASWAVMKLPVGRVADFSDSVQQAAISTSLSDGVYQVDDHSMLLVVVLMGAILAIATVFLYRNRPLQSKMSTVLLFICLLSGILAFYFIYRDLQLVKELTQVQFSPTYGAFVPMVGIILAFMARRSIEKDEKLVRSMDRLR